MVIKPILPPKQGYVEIIDPNTKEHVYKPIESTIQLSKNEYLFQTYNKLLIEQEYKISLLEFGLKQKGEHIMLFDIVQQLIDSNTIQHDELAKKLDVFYAVNRLSEEEYLILIKQLHV